ncbi:MAG: protein translocase subunit SecD [Peptococcaceae bacterium]|nr:protein translocase subunit SecD [Peptococcaceae bacterium]
MKWGNIAKIAAVIVVVAAVAVAAFVPVKNVSWLPLTKDINLGLDLKGGVHVVLQAVDTEDTKVTKDAVRRAKAILERRVNEFGVANPVIQLQGDRRIIVEIAGVKNPNEVVDKLIRPAYLEFKTEDGRTVLTGRDLKNAQESMMPESNLAQVNLTFTKEGADKFAEITSNNVGRPLAIFLDGELLQAPEIREPIRNGQARITNYESLESAHQIAVLLRSGALPVKLDVMEKRTVGPTLGRDSLDRSVKAGIIGAVAILLFMIGYYRVPGVIAGFALAVYALLVLLIFSAFNVTMTLSGIAGFLLSLGIAIDANVIIFERIKEELRTRRTLRSAIDAGFKRAFVAIVDANVTTLLAAGVLYYFAPIIVKGFALTLSIGILVSMFTALTFTKYLLHLVAGSGLKNPKLYGA